jgi:hypothetical protein
MVRVCSEPGHLGVGQNDGDATKNYYPNYQAAEKAAAFMARCLVACVVATQKIVVAQRRDAVVVAFVQQVYSGRYRRGTFLRYGSCGHSTAAAFTRQAGTATKPTQRAT